MAYMQKKFVQKWFAFGSGLLIGSMGVLSSEAVAVSNDDDNLQYRWRLLQQPAGSALIIKDSKSITPEFKQFNSGRYRFELIVKEPSSTTNQVIRTPTSVVRVPASRGRPQAGSEALNSTEQTGAVRAVVRAPSGGIRVVAGGGRGGLLAQRVVTSVLLESPVEQHNVPITFGHLFAKGDVPAGTSLRGHREDGSFVDLQVNHKARYDDGSLRHAIISANIDTLQASKKHRLGFLLTAGSAKIGNKTPVQLVNQGFQASVELVIDGQRYTASPIAGMKGTEYKNTASPVVAMKETEYKIWLRGELVNEWLVVAPFKAAGGGEHAHLMARFYIRSYASGQIRVSTVVENNWAFQARPSNLTYDLNVKIGGHSVHQESALTHYHHARWRKVFWVNGENPQVMIAHNAEYMMATKAIPNYDRSLTLPETTLENIETRWKKGKGMMDVGSATHYMPSTGAHEDIGPLPLWTVSYLLTMDPRAKQATLGTAELAGSWSNHYRDRQTGLPVSLEDHPYISTHSNLIGRPIYALPAQEGERPIEYLFNQDDNYFPQTETEFWQGGVDGRETAFAIPLRPVDFAPISGATSATPIAACQGDCVLRPGYQADTAHQPSLSYVPYMVTGDYYHLEELQFWASGNMLGTSAGSRDNEKGLLKWQQVRGQAWSMRTLGDTAFITPDDDPMKAYFIERVKHNLDFYNENMSNNPAANKLGFAGETEYNYQFPYNKNRGIAPWQDDFFTWSVAHLADLGFSDAEPLLQWKAKFPVGRVMAPGYCWAFAAAYSVNVRDSGDGAFYNTFAKMYQETIPALVRQEACASQAMIDTSNAFILNGIPRLKWTKITDETGKVRWESEVVLEAGTGTACVDAKCSTLYDREFSQVNEIGGYPHSPVGFPSNMQPALAVVVDYGVHQGREAWNRFEARSIKPDYNDYPNWAIIPR